MRREMRNAKKFQLIKSNVYEPEFLLVFWCESYGRGKFLPASIIAHIPFKKKGLINPLSVRLDSFSFFFRRSFYVEKEKNRSEIKFSMSVAQHSAR